MSTFTNPTEAAAYAMKHGGFTTSAREAFRILEDGRRHLESRASAARLGESVAVLDISTDLWIAVAGTLTWVEANKDDPEVQFCAQEWIGNEQDRYVAMNTLTKVVIGKYIYELQPS